jgi:hypothetical protein
MEVGRLSDWTSEEQFAYIENSERFFNWSVAPWRRRRVVSLELLVLLVARVGLVASYQLDGQLVQPVKVVRCVSDFIWFVAKPVDYIFDARKELFLFLFGVCVVETQVTVAVVLLRIAEVEVDGFCVADVQYTVRFRWEACEDFAAGFAQMLFHEVHGLVGDHVAFSLVVFTCKTIKKLGNIINIA